VSEREGRRIAGQISGMIREFWRNVDTVVDLRAKVSYILPSDLTRI